MEEKRRLAPSDQKDRPLLLGRGLTKVFSAADHRSPARVAVDGINLSLWSGECLAIIGSSGSGKTTLSRLLLGQLSPDAGRLQYQGADVLPYSSAARSLAVDSSLVFQNPFDSLDPRWTVGRSVAEPLVAAQGRRQGGRRLGFRGGVNLHQEVAHILTRVHLDPDRIMGAYPSDLSGGQAQRVAIARALIVPPRILLADEPMSAIDVSARVEILHTLQSIMNDARRGMTGIGGMSMILISHDLGVVQHIADRVAVLHRGHLVEEGSVEDILSHPHDAYTRQLISSAIL